jgi:uncharacterized protein involved in exopolysaccharide biosynthesis
MSSYPLTPRNAPITVTTPIIPLNFVYPALSRSQLASIVRAYWGSILGIACLVFGIALAAIAAWPRTYTAGVTLMVNYAVNDPANGKELPLGQLESYIATQVELMQTPEDLLAVVDRLNLTEYSDYTRGYRGDSGTLREWAAEQLRKRMAIYQGFQGSQLIHISYSARTAVESANVANALADVYKEQEILRATSQPGERAKRYAAQLEDLKNKVDIAQQNVTAFHQRNGLIDDGTKTNVDVALLATLEGRLAEAEDSRRVAEARAAGDQAVSDQALASPEVQALKTQLAGQDQTIAQLSANYLPGYPALRDAEAQRESTLRSLKVALSRYSANASGGLRVAERLQRSLSQAVTEQRGRVLRYGQLHDEAAKYQLELESAQTVYKRALEDYDQIMFAAGSHYSNVAVVSRATPPVAASKPRVLVGLVLGAVAAVVLGLGVPLFYEFFHRRVRCRDDLERHHGVPVLIEFGRRPAAYRS